MNQESRIHPITKKDQTFWQFITDGFSGKLYSFGCTLAMITGIICVHTIGTLSWGDFDSVVAYPINIFFGVICFLVLRSIAESILITITLAGLSYFFKWDGFADGFCFYWLFIYWVGYYVSWSKGEAGKIS